MTSEPSSLGRSLPTTAGVPVELPPGADVVAPPAGGTAAEPAQASIAGRTTGGRVLPPGVAIAITVVAGAIFYFYTTHGTGNPLYEQPEGGFASEFFVTQAQAIVHGHLYVPPSQLPAECFMSRGNCYGYFGVTPSILRLPFLALLDQAHHSLTPVFLSLALMTAVGASLAIASRAWARIEATRSLRVLATLIACSLGPASFLIQLARPAVYEEAIAWAVAFAMIAIYCFQRWWTEPSWRWSIPLIASLALSTNARPTTLPLSVILGAAMVIRTARRDRRAYGLAAGIGTMTLPVVLCFLVFWEKFHQLDPSLLLNVEIGSKAAAPWWIHIRQVDHNSLQGIRFLPTSLLAYLRPDSLGFVSTFPYIDFRFATFANIPLLGIPAGAMYVEQFSTVTDDESLLLALILAGAVYGARTLWQRRAAERTTIRQLLNSWSTYAILGTAGASSVTLTTVAITNRYVGDFVPFVAVGAITAFATLAEPFSRLSSRSRIVILVVVALAMLWGLYVNLGLEYRVWWQLVG